MTPPRFRGTTTMARWPSQRPPSPTSTIRRTGRLLTPSMPVSSSTFPALPPQAARGRCISAPIGCGNPRLGYSNNSLLIVWFDEDDSGGNNQVPLILYGAHVVPGTYGTAYNHYNTLATICAAMSITPPRNAAGVSTFGVFTAAPPPPPPPR